MEANQKWIPFIHEMMEVLITKYKDNRKPLHDWIFKNLPALNLKFLKKEDLPISDDIDPISILATSFYLLQDEYIKDPLLKFKEFLDLKSEVPEDFSAWVVLGINGNIIDSHTTKEQIDTIWNLAEALIYDKPIGDLYDRVIEITHKKVAVTAWMYYLNPQKYICIYTALMRYLKDYGIKEVVSCTHYKEYNQFCQSLQNRLTTDEIEENSFIDLTARLKAYSRTNENKLPVVWIWHGADEGKRTDHLESGKLFFDNNNDFDEMLKSSASSIEEYGKSIGAHFEGRNVACSWWNLMHTVKIGDVVVLADSWNIIAWGRISVLAQIDKTLRVHKFITVNWEDKTKISAPFSINGLFFKKASIDKAKQLVDLLQIPLEFTETDNLTNGESTNSPMKTSKYQEYIDLLKTNKNLILTGAPGTGKTYMAKAIAKEMNAISEFVQFHPSFDYTDFVEGLRPIKKDNVIGFERKDGIFKEFCKKALVNSLKSENNLTPNAAKPSFDKPYVFIIDEINRGELSKIFGELFFALDPGYRGIKGKVKTQYQNLVEEDDLFADGFYVPENVYILATMNDIDRSVESMDFAMRRRFAWKEVIPDDTKDMLDDLDPSTASEAKAAMERINRIISNTEGLGDAFMVGPSYFLKLTQHGNDFAKLWKLNLEPLLKEYLRGFRNVNEIMRKFKNAYENKTSEVENTTEVQDEKVIDPEE